MPHHDEQKDMEPNRVEPTDETISDDDAATLMPAPESENDTLPASGSTLGASDADDMETLVEGPWQRPADLDLRFSASRRIRTFGDYELLDEIARGGMGVVYRARQSKLNRIVALKMILAGQLASEQEVQRFYIEAEAAANLEHSGIIPIYEIGQHDGQHFFSMGFVQGESLAQRLIRGPVPPREAAEITMKIADAIAYAHQRNVIHRDLKPANILIDSDGQPKVTDFGLAKKTEGAEGLTSTGQILGTPAYMPPEQATGRTSEVDARSDVYSLGAVLYALLTGRPPFETASVMDTLKHVIDQDPVAPRRLNSVIHPDLETICQKCLAKRPEDRYQSAEELKLELQRFLNGEAIQARASTILSRTWSTVLSETRHTEVLGMWSKVWYWHASLVFALFWLTSLLLWTDAGPLPIVALWVPGFFAVIAVVWYFRFRVPVQLTPIERQIAQVWAMFGVAAVLTGVINHLMGLDTLQLLPLVVLECGLAFCCMAAILGGSFYPIGIACFVIAVLMPVVPALGAAIFGTLFAVGLLVPAVKYAPKES